MEEVYWSDVAERLGLSKTLAKEINAKFGTILGITPSNKVPRTSLGAISMIVTMRAQGFSDEEIAKTLLESKGEQGWPDVILGRMVDEVATSATRALESCALKPPPDKQVHDSPRSWSERVELAAGSRGSQASVQEMILDLRREICTNTISEKEEIQRLTQAIHRLIAEVRDLRYALVMAASRKDRKKGLKGLSRLLSRR